MPFADFHRTQAELSGRSLPGGRGCLIHGHAQEDVRLINGPAMIFKQTSIVILESFYPLSLLQAQV
jgi:hypothetical protein